MATSSPSAISTTLTDVTDDYAFPSRIDHTAHPSTRHYARLVDEWVTGVGLLSEDYGTHALRRTKASIIYKVSKSALDPPDTVRGDRDGRRRSWCLGEPQLRQARRLRRPVSGYPSGARTRLGEFVPPVAEESQA